MAARTLVAAAACALACAAPYMLTTNVTHLSTMHAIANISWSGINSASSGDWISVACGSPTGNYYWWDYTSGKSSDSQVFDLWVNGKASGCDSILVNYYDSKTNVVAQTQQITFDPMIQQIHLTYLNTSTVTVDFVSSAAGTTPSCSFGTSPYRLTQLAPALSQTLRNVGLTAQALFTGLQADTVYYYACTDGVATSEVFSFHNNPSVSTLGRPLAFSVFADFGVDDGFGLSQLAADAQQGLWDLALHAGDFAYDFESDNSANGNFFMNRASTSYAASRPVQPSPGNHEGGNNFTEYKQRHNAVALYGNSGTAMYYSFEWAGVHFLSFNSETYVDGGIEAMLNWIQADLAAVDRGVTPWVVAFGHKLWWMDNAPNIIQVFQLFQQYNVDVVFTGHWHYYQRYAPVFPQSADPSLNQTYVDWASMSSDNHTYTNPKYPTMIVSGAPGDVERNDACPGDDRVAPYTPACSPGYGYGTVQVWNSTHLYWQFTALQTPIGEHRRAMREAEAQGLPAPAPVTYTDYLWIVKGQ